MTQEIIELETTDTDMDGFQFVIRAMKDRMSPKTNKCSNNCVKIEDGKLIGTDGQRLHIYELRETYVPGIYRVYKSLKAHIILGTEDETNYKKGFPDHEQFTCLFDDPDDEIEKAFPDSDIGIVDGLTALIRKMESWESVSPKFLKDLDDTFLCSIDSKKDYLCFRSHRKYAYVSKVKIEE